jgi:hypothetical protein
LRRGVEELAGGELFGRVAWAKIRPAVEQKSRNPRVAGILVRLPVRVDRPPLVTNDITGGDRVTKGGYQYKEKPGGYCLN